jgi:hypothetical protein
VIGLGARVAFLLPVMDASNDTRALDFLQHALTEIPQDAIAIVNGDEYIFSLWYAQFALGERPDMVVIAEGLLAYD